MGNTSSSGGGGGGFHGSGGGGFRGSGTDYSSSGSFNKAFASAHRDMGPGHTFDFNGRSYTTNRADGRDMSARSSTGTFADLHNFTSRAEGGYSNVTHDRGGKTNYGVTQRTYNAYAKQNGIHAKDVKTLTKAEASRVMKVEFYERPKIDQLQNVAPKTAKVVYDFGVNSGPGTAVKNLQNIIGVPSDGRIGPETLEAVKSFPGGDQKLAEAQLDQRQKHVNNIVKNDPTQKKFESGWNNRIQNLRNEIRTDK